MELSYTELEQPIVMLSPMAGYTTSAYRRVVKEIAPEVIVCTELVSVDGIRYNSKKTRRFIIKDSIEQPLLLQLFGNNPEYFAEAAKMAEDLGFAGIDLNMGCPAKKVVKNEYGSALIENPQLAARVIDAIKSACTLPVSVKTRLGYADSSELLSFGKQMEAAGASLIIVHGRTVKQVHKGEADWEPIYKLQHELSIPVIGNGGVSSYADGVSKVQNLGGFTIGRAALGNPWVFLKDAPRIPLEQRLTTLQRHLTLAIEDLGEPLAVREFRKWLPWYLNEFPGSKQLRKKLLETTTCDEFQRIIHTYRQEALLAQMEV